MSALALSFALICAAQDAAAFIVPKTHLAQDQVRVAMEHAARIPVVEAKLNGRGPYRFLLDTGAGGHGRIDRKLAAELQLPAAGEVVAGDGTGVNDRRARLLAVDCVELGAARFEGLQFLEGDYANRLPGAAGVAGVLGYGLFADLLWTVDYPHQALILRRGALAADAPHVIGYDDARGVASVPLRLGAHELHAHVDSGNMGGLMLPSSWLRRLNLIGQPMERGRAATTNNEVPVVVAEFEDALQIAGHRFQRSTADFAELFQTANLGYDALRPFALTFDPKNRRLQFAHGGGDLVLAPAPPRFGVALRPTHAGLEVDQIMAGSRAERAGLLAGDLILEVDGAAAAALHDSGQLGAIFGSGRPLRLRLRRGGEELELAVP